MDSLGKLIIASSLTVGAVVGAVGGGLIGTTYILRYWEETKMKLFGKVVVLGTKTLPESFPVEAVVFDTLVRATVTNITATPVYDVDVSNKEKEADSPGKDSGFGTL